MIRLLIVAFVAGAAVDHLLYQETKIRKLTNDAARFAGKPTPAPRSLASIQDQNESEGTYSTIMPEFTTSLFKPDYSTPRLFLDMNAPDQSALDLASKLADKWGFTSSEIAPHTDGKIESASQAVWDFQQVRDGYEVYGSRLRLVALQNTGEVLLVNNDLHPIESFAPTVNFTALDSEVVLAARFKDLSPQVALRPETPVVWPTKSAELAWVFIVNVQGSEPDTLRVAVGANTGHVLMTESARIDN